MTTEQNKAIVRRFFEAFEANDIASLKEVLAPELVAYTHASPDPQSRDAQLQAIEMWNAVFSETRFTIQEQIAEGDKVATRVAMQAVHDLGDFQGLAPSGKQIEVTGISIERIKEGKIVERLVSSDWFGMMQQLGLIPPQPAYG